MAKPIKNKNKKGSGKKQPSRKENKKKTYWLQVIVVIGIIGAIILLSIKPDFGDEPQRKPKKKSEPEFKKEGVLTFFRNTSGDTIKTIDIEIAENDYERARGLMYRTKLNSRQGMLFIMEQEEPQAFWMKNTYISLDIIYLDAELRIVSIQKYTQPRSTESLPSFKNAKYVVEVIAGFCDELEIIDGDFVTFER